MERVAARADSWASSRHTSLGTLPKGPAGVPSGRIDDAPTGREALREAIALQAWLKPRLRGVATAMDVLRRTDPAADAAWKERGHARLERCEQVVRRLAEEADLGPG
ncbi:MAG TPA: hypothetical protein VHH09_05760 [Acidimicrobiales bacterium]|nr:hypothetical protein [Acidimicrobiales bacterium]